MTENRRAFWQSFRLLVVFQIKLAADALRDLFLSPVSVTCLLLDWIFGLHGKKSLYIKLMDLGVRSDHFINLFGQHEGEDNIDKAVKKVEEKLIQDRDQSSSGCR